MHDKSNAIRGGFSLTFAGQAGFIIALSNGYRIGIDLYLSDCCNRYFGFKRLLPYIYDPMSLELDILIATHAHYDHFDPDSVPLILSDAKTELACAFDVRTEAERLGLDQSRITYLRVGDVLKKECVTFEAVPCDHGASTPDAIGLLIEAEGKKIYITGDTSYREDFFRNKRLQNADLMIMPINGQFGNMNEREAAQAVSDLRPKLAVPCHYWNFAEHGGDPLLFSKALSELAGENPYLLMRPGETILLK